MSETIEQRIIANIRIEVRHHVRGDKPLPKRDKRWKDITDKLIVEEKEMFAKDVEAKNMADYESLSTNMRRSFRTTADGLSYDEWLDKAEKLYSIGPRYEVVSIASKNKERIWECCSFWEAKNKILTLIGYKYFDHFYKGHGFRWDPDGEQDEQART